MNLCYVDCDKPKDNGLSTYTYELLKAYKIQQGWSLYCVWTDSIRYETIHEEVIDHIHHLFIPINLRKTGKNYESECADIIIKFMADKTDLIVHFNWINHCPIAWLLKQRTKVLTVLTKHCIPWRDLITSDYAQFHTINTAFEGNMPLKIKNLQLRREQIYYDSIDHIITVTHFAKKSLTQLFKLPSDKITVVNNGLAEIKIGKTTKISKAKLRSKYGFSPDEKLILYVGNVHPRKGVHDLLSAFEKLSGKKAFNDVRLVIAGPGNYHEALKVVEKHWSKITFTGVLNKQVLSDFYKMADIGVVPSYVEQCSYTVIEMMQHILPIMVSDVDGLKEMINPECGLKLKLVLTDRFASIDKNDLVNKISYLLSNPGQAALLANNAQKFAIKHFNATRMADETISVYRLLLKDHQKSDTPANKIAVNSIPPPLVSIILPCYNAEQYLKCCLNSIFNQTYHNFELIIVDDGSTDTTRQIIDAIEDPRVIRIKNNSNLGVTACLNNCISMAKGKYIARMDADDLMHQDRLKLQVSFLEENPDYGLVGSGYNVIDVNGMPANRAEPMHTNNELKLTLLFFNPFAHPTIMTRTEIFKAMLYDPIYRHCEDYELWFRISEHYKIINLHETLLNYRIHNENTSIKNNNQMKENVVSLLSRELDKLEIEHTPEELMLHAAISFGLGIKYFNNIEKIKKLNTWLDKIFSSPKIVNNFTDRHLKDFKGYISQKCCSLN